MKLASFEAIVRVLEVAGRSQDKIDIGYLRIRLDQDEQNRN